MRTCALTGVVVGVIALACAGSARADDGYGWESTSPGTGVTIGAGSNTSSPASPHQTKPSPCVWQARTAPSLPPGMPTGGYDASGKWIPAGTPGQWYVVICNGQATQAHFVPAGPALVAPSQLAQQARSQLPFPFPAAQLSPPADDAHWQYVNLPTWAWLGAGAWQPLQTIVGVPGVSVTAVAKPVAVIWRYENGTGNWTTITCQGPGSPHPLNASVSQPSPDCGWTWQQSSASSPDERLGVSAQVVYRVSWAVSGAAGGGDLGEVQGPTTTFRVKVGEVQALEQTSG